MINWETASNLAGNRIWKKFEGGGQGKKVRTISIYITSQSTKENVIHQEPKSSDDRCTVLIMGETCDR